VAETEMPCVTQQANTDRAAPRDHADIAGQSVRIAQLLTISLK
jgi:hypothetical protein